MRPQKGSPAVIRAFIWQQIIRELHLTGSPPRVHMWIGGKKTPKARGRKGLHSERKGNELKQSWGDAWKDIDMDTGQGVGGRDCH